MKRKLLYCIMFFWLLYSLWIFCMGYLVNNWYTNSKSEEVEIEKEKLFFLPDEVVNAQCVKFVLDWVENRVVFNEALKKYSKELWLNYNIVLSSILWEQIRISCKWVRGKLKNIIVNWTPTLFRSYDISVGIAWIKVWTALKVKRDAINYGYWDWIKNDLITEERLSKNDELSAKVAVYLIQNIIHRRWIEWYDISMNAGIVWTLYNMGNREDKIPHENPKIWWAIIDIHWQKFTYWEISLWIYNLLSTQK